MMVGLFILITAVGLFGDILVRKMYNKVTRLKAGKVPPSPTDILVGLICQDLHNFRQEKSPRYLKSASQILGENYKIDFHIRYFLEHRRPENGFTLSIWSVRLFDKNLSIGEENEKTLAKACKAFILRKEEEVKIQKKFNEEMEAANLLERWMVGPKPTAPAIPAPSLLEIEKVKTL